jgi:hypothetical protein
MHAPRRDGTARTSIGAAATSLLLVDREKRELVRMAIARDAAGGNCEVRSAPTGRTVGL